MVVFEYTHLKLSEDNLMRYPVSAGIDAIVVGSLMIIMWSIFVATGLVIGGALTIRIIRLGVPILLFSMGLLMYTLIVSPGYYIEGGALSRIRDSQGVLVPLGVYGEDFIILELRSDLH